VENPSITGQGEEIKELAWMPYETLEKKLRSKMRDRMFNREYSLGVAIAT
jgi:hypothetical protein